MALKYTPYDGSHPLFKIGLQPLDLEDWLEVDEHLAFYLQEKQRLARIYGDKIFVAEDDTFQAQAEVLELIKDYVLERFPDQYQLADGGKTIDIPTAKQSVVLEDASSSSLMVASRLVQEDIVLMRKGDNGWRLAAASLCFPSSWSLLEKFGKPLDQIHDTVPGFGPGSKNAGMIFRIFDNLKVEHPVRRFNWSIYSDDELFHDDRAAEHLRKRDFEAGIFLRVEHQTLRKLPVSGDILFTVRIHIDPMDKLAQHPRRRDICQGAVASLQDLDVAQLAYKGLTKERDRLITQLNKIAEEAAYS
ncbi:MAG: DUF3445 domain-containing protein [Salaquimonas sp.]